MFPSVSFWRCRRFKTKRRNKFACSKISSLMSAISFALIFPRAERASTFDISAERNVWPQSALRSFAIVCDYVETALFAIVCDLRSAIRDRLRSSVIIWKPAIRKPEKVRTSTGFEPVTSRYRSLHNIDSCSLVILVFQAIWLVRYFEVIEHYSLRRE